MKEQYSYKGIWKLTWPLIISGYGQTIINITDTVFLGRLGEVAIGASAIAGLLYVTLMMIAYGLASGAQIMIARFDGAQLPHQVGEVFDATWLIQLGFSIVIFSLSYLLLDSFLYLFISSEEIRIASREFLVWRFPGYFPAFLISAYRPFYSGLGNTKVISYVTILMALLNVLFNFLFVYGFAAIPALGIKGSAIASTLAEYLSLLFIVVYTGLYVDKKYYGIYSFKSIRKKVVKELMTLSVPLIFQFFISLVSWFLFFLIIEKMGQRPLAISNLIRNIYMVLMAPLLAFSQATSTVVSNLIGQRKIHEIFATLKRILLFSLLITLGVDLINLISPKTLFFIFTNDLELIESSISTLRVMSFSLVLFSVSIPFLSAVSAVGHSRASFVIEFTTMFAYVGLTYLAVNTFHTSLEVVWMVEVVYFLMIGLSAYFYLNYVLKNSLIVEQ